ncbi:UDP-GalNAc:beta-1,3-N-acetylgalactosaminyltransferase 1-like [Haliotis rufescens]|uniref:UDP-GalNAc:beta-1, 3-N-acetylgalactosaminyltransferase 1-like n=1 Tax=Haliotis rufescens TaxID=6454 RepID=UPI00201F2112|nr:UDP-GalNAc:beta-1,3-N-acetylgalactosaminyltransferase 1-like [Haliotis rufescens]
MRLKRNLKWMCYCLGVCVCLYWGIGLSRTKDDSLTPTDHTAQHTVLEQPKHQQTGLNNKPSGLVGLKQSEVPTKNVKPFHEEAKQINEHDKHMSRGYSLPPALLNGTDMNPKIMAFLTMNASDHRDRYINLHQFMYSLNTSVCSNTNVFLMLVIHSATGNARKRERIRKTYGSVAKYKGRKLAHVFMLGTSNNDRVQNSIINESKLYGDIVQGNFPDIYTSLPRKHIMSMDWYLRHCNSSYILKLDDDVFINPYRVVDFLTGGHLDQRTMYCTKITGRGPVRGSKYKSYVSYEEYPFDIYPSFCLGYAYITTPGVWHLMHEVSKNSKSLRMDDVFVSTALAMKAGVQKVDFGKIIFDCRFHMKDLNKETLQKKAIVMDRAYVCGHQPFTYWDLIKED